MRKVEAYKCDHCSKLLEDAAKMLNHERTCFMNKKRYARYFSLIEKAAEIEEGSLLSDTQKQKVVDARHVVMYKLKTSYSLNLQQIAELLGKKTHATVIHGINKVSDLVLHNREYSDFYTKLIEIEL